MARNRKVEFTVEVIDKATAKLNTIAGKFQDFSKRVAGAALSMAKVFAAATTAVFALANKISKDLDVYDKLNKRLGISVEALSQFEFIANRSGISFRNMSLALQRMTRRVGEASKGMGEGQVALKELNLSAKDLAQLSPDRQFKVIAEALTKVENPALRLAAAFKLFDSEGVAVLQTLDKGVEGLEAMAKEADKLGATMSEKAVKAAADYQDALANLKGASNFLSQEFAENLLPTLTDLVNMFARVIPSAIARLNLAFTAMRKGSVGLLASLTKVAAVANRAFAFAGPGFLKDAHKYEEITKNLEEQAIAYEDVIQEQLKYISKLKEIGAVSKGATGLTSPTASVGGADSDASGPVGELERIVINVRRRTQASFDFIQEAAKRAAGNVQDAFADFFFDPFKDGLKGLLANFINVIRRMIAEVLAFKAVKSIFGGSDSFGNLLGSVFGRASGGPVGPNRTVMVGERGPEPVTFGSRGGYVTSNAAMKTRGQNGMQFVTNIDARGADPGLIARLPKYLEDRDKRLMLAFKRFTETGTMPI